MSGASTLLKKKEYSRPLFNTPCGRDTITWIEMVFKKNKKKKEIVFLNMVLVRALTLGFTNIPKFKFIWVYVYIAFLKQQ